MPKAPSKKIIERRQRIEKILPLNGLAPGQYTLRVKITDKNRNQVLTPSAQFTVT